MLFRKLKSGEYREARPGEVKSELGRINNAKVKHRSGGRVWAKHSVKAGDKCRCVRCYLKRGKSMAEIEIMRRGSNVPRETLPRRDDGALPLRRFRLQGRFFGRRGTQTPNRTPNASEGPPEERAAGASQRAAASQPATDPNDAAVDRILGDLPPARRISNPRPPKGPPADGTRDAGRGLREKPETPKPAAPKSDKKKYEPRPNFGVRSRYFD